jgi:hypothetical protein
MSWVTGRQGGRVIGSWSLRGRLGRTASGSAQAVFWAAIGGTLVTAAGVGGSGVSWCPEACTSLGPRTLDGRRILASGREARSLPWVEGGCGSGIERATR